MSISRNPITAIPFEELGVRDEQFAHKSEIHGQGHVNRVIYNTLVLSKVMGLDEWMVPAWAAAYIHDLSRRHDGVCHEHGRWAVKEQWDKYLPLFRRAGLNPNHDCFVQDAVAVHCYPNDPPRLHPVTAILKDADGLDRCRLGDLDTRFLRLEYAAPHARKAHELWAATQGKDDSWQGVWEQAMPIYNPHLGMSKSIRDFWDVIEEPQARMCRRLSQGMFKDVMEQVIALPWTVLHERMKMAPRLRTALEEWQQSTEVSSGQPTTYMTPETYEKFMETGVLKSVWELEDEGIKAWHSKFNDSPIDARALMENRLFGEKGRRITYAIMNVPSLFGNVDRNLTRMYGGCKITWNSEVLDYASFTINDSQSSRFCLPYEALLVEKVLAMYWVVAMTGILGTYDKEIMNLLPQVEKPRYIELQIHRQLTKNDVKSAEYCKGS